MKAILGFEITVLTFLCAILLMLINQGFKL